VYQVLFLGQYFKSANFSGAKLILNSNLQTLMAAKNVWIYSNYLGLTTYHTN